MKKLFLIALIAISFSTFGYFENDPTGCENTVDFIMDSFEKYLAQKKEDLDNETIKNFHEMGEIGPMMFVMWTQTQLITTQEITHLLLSECIGKKEFELIQKEAEALDTKITNLDWVRKRAKEACKKKYQQ